MDRNNERLPYVFLAVSNPSQDLPGVETESGAILSALEIAKAAGLIGEVIDPPRTLTLTELIRPFQNSNYRGRIAIFHYAGHGSPSQLLLEGPTSAGQLAYAGGFAQFLSTQFSLKLVFLNACSTRPQVDALLQKAGVDVVIATSQCIRDEIARMFAEEFYQALARDVTVLEAFEQAAGVVQTKFGDGYRELIRPEFLPTVGSAEPGNSASLRALVWGEETGGTTREAKVSPWALFPRGVPGLRCVETVGAEGGPDLRATAAAEAGLPRGALSRLPAVHPTRRAGVLRTMALHPGSLRGHHFTRNRPYSADLRRQRRGEIIPAGSRFGSTVGTHRGTRSQTPG